MFSSTFFFLKLDYNIIFWFYYLCRHYMYCCKTSRFFFLFFCFVFFFAFQGHTHSIWKFPGQGSNGSYSCWPTPQQHRIRATSATYTTAHRNAGSLTHWSRPGIEPTFSGILVWFVNLWETKGTLQIQVWILPLPHLTVWLWRNQFLLLCYSFLIHKKEIIIMCWGLYNIHKNFYT